MISKRLQRLITLSIIVLILLIPIVHAQSATPQNSSIYVKRTIYVYQGFLIVNDSIQLPNNVSSFDYLYNTLEYDSIYTVKTIPSVPIIWGKFLNGLQGFEIDNGNLTNITLITVYNYTIFSQTVQGYAVNITAYPLINYTIKNGSATVIFKFSVSTYQVSSPNGTKLKLSPSGESTIVYNFNNITPFKRTPLYFNFTPSNTLQFPKITKFTREIQIVSSSNAQIIDRISISYTGFGGNISQFNPPLLPGSQVIQVYDSLGNLTYQNGSVILRYPLESSVLGGINTTITVVSQIPLSELKNNTNSLISYNFLTNNTYLINVFYLEIDSKYINDISLTPIPDKVNYLKNFNQYVYILNNVFPGESLNVNVNGNLQIFITTLNIFNQILFLITIISFIAFIYIRFYFKARKVELPLKIQEIKKYIQLFESLILNNEEMLKLDEQLRRGVLKKKDYNLRIENIMKENSSNERELKRISSIISKENPSLIKLLNELENTYQRMVKDTNALKDLIMSYEQKRISIEQYRRMYNVYTRNIQSSRAKIDSLLSELRTKIT